jgi:transposase
MRGDSTQQAIVFSALTPDQLVPQDHPIRRIKPIVDRVLRELWPVFRTMYAPVGRPSIPPEHLLKASLLIALFSVRSERQFCERLQYDLLFKWFLDLNIGDRAFDASTFSKNRQRLLAHDVARQFFLAVRAEADRSGLLSDDHFSVDGTLLEAWASQKSYRPRDEHDPPASGGGRNAGVDFHGERRRRDTHVSRTDPQALLYRKGRGQPAKLCFLGHVLTENRHGLVVDVELTTATGSAEREAAQRMLRRSTTGRATVAADRGYDTRDFVAGLPLSRSDTPCRPQHGAPPERHRRTHDPPRRLRAEPASPQAGGRGLRLDEDRRRRPQAALHRRRA